MVLLLMSFVFLHGTDAIQLGWLGYQPWHCQAILLPSYMVLLLLMPFIALLGTDAIQFGWLES